MAVDDILVLFFLFIFKKSNNLRMSSATVDLLGDFKGKGMISELKSEEY